MKLSAQLGEAFTQHLFVVRNVGFQLGQVFFSSQMNSP
jgi:hypothetical protein